MGKSMFTIKGNICSERVRLGRALQKPPITQEDLAKKLQFMGMEDMTPLIISRIEKNQRHVWFVENEYGNRFYLDTYGSKWLAFLSENE